MIRRARPLAIALPLLGCVSACSLWPGYDDRKTNDRPLPGEQAPAQTVDPNMQRPEVGIKQIKAQDFEVGGYAGILVVNRNLTQGIYGVRAAYHKSENLFVEGNYAFNSKVGFKEVRDAVGSSTTPNVDYKTYGFSVGYNLFPGDLYLSKNFTVPFVLYAIGGLGYARLEDDGHTAYSLGGGLKLMPTDWLALRFELRDQAWSNKGSSRDDNAEFTVGLAGYF